MTDSRGINLPSEYHKNSIIIVDSSGNVADAAAVATLDSDAGRLTYITGFDVYGAGSTTALPVTVTVSGIKGGSLVYNYVFEAGVLVRNTPLEIRFKKPIPASAVDTDIVVTCLAGGAGNTHNTVNAYGFKL